MLLLFFWGSGIKPQLLHQGVLSFKKFFGPFWDDKSAKSSDSPGLELTTAAQSSYRLSHLLWDNSPSLGLFTSSFWWQSQRFERGSNPHHKKLKGIPKYPELPDQWVFWSVSWRFWVFFSVFSFKVLSLTSSAHLSETGVHQIGSAEDVRFCSILFCSILNPGWSVGMIFSKHF